jgi:hypothetical protein
MAAVNETAVEYSHKIFNSLIPPESDVVEIDIAALLESLAVVGSYFISRAPREDRNKLIALWHEQALAMTARLILDDMESKGMDVY